MTDKERMKKPEKKEENMYDEAWSLDRTIGYNQACDDHEPYIKSLKEAHKQALIDARIDELEYIIDWLFENHYNEIVNSAHLFNRKYKFKKEHNALDL